MLIRSGVACSNFVPIWRRSRQRAITRADATPAQYDAVIVGGGISGLCTAHVLSTDHKSSVPKFLLTEARGRLGGNITSRENDAGYIWEEGPNSCTPSDGFLKMAVSVGIENELVLGDSKAPRFVYWDNKLRKTPSGPDALTFDLLSPWGKIRAGLGAVGVKAPPPPDREETVEEFITRNLGVEAFQRLIEPFCSGVYAGDPSKLSMKAAFGKIQALEENGGSLVGGAIKLFQERRKNPGPERDSALPPKPAGQTVASFKKGLKTLPEAIANRLSDKIKINWKLKRVAQDDKGLFILDYETPEGMQSIASKTVALTVPSYVAAEILQPVSDDVFEALSSFDYPPVAAVTLSYPLAAIREDRLDKNGALPGFGQLHPRSQGIVTLGTIYSSSLFPNRAPEGRVLFLNYIGGSTNRGIVDQTEDELVRQVDGDLRKLLLKANAPEPETIGVRVWPKAIPQFNLGHLESLKRARDALDSKCWARMILGGNYVCGVALQKCVEYGYDLAAELAESVAKYEAPSKSVVSAS
eukprot:g1552.t1